MKLGELVVLKNVKHIPQNSALFKLEEKKKTTAWIKTYDLH